jgi:SNF2 family DNA or RNA helicase
VALFLKRSDVGLANAKIYERRSLALPPTIKRLYEQLERDFIMDLPDGSTYQTIFAGAKFSMLRQLCGGFGAGKFLDDFKCKAVVDLLKGELKNEPIIIWANFIQEIKMLHACLTKAGIGAFFIYSKIKPEERDEIREQFQAGLINVLVVQPEVWRYGTLLSRASGMIYFSSPVSGLTRSQTEDRTIDVEAQNSALIIDLPCEGTIEEDILKGLKAKESQDKIMRRIIQGIQRRQGVIA